MGLGNDISIESKINEAEVCRNMGLHQDALKIYERVIDELSPRDIEPLEQCRKMIQLLQKEIVDREKILPQSIPDGDIDTIFDQLPEHDDPPAIFNKASAFEEMGMYKQSITELVKLFDEDYPVEVVVPVLAGCLLKLHSPLKAAEKFNRLIGNLKVAGDSSARIAFLFGQELENRDHREEALDIYKTAHGIAPADAEINQALETIAASFATGSKYDYLLNENLVTTDQLQKAFALSKKVKKEYDKIFKSGEVLETEETTMVGDHTFNTITRKKPIIEDGKVAQVMTIIRDITERKQAMEAVEDRERRFTRMAENIHDGLTIIENEKVVYVNERACEIYGYPREELMKMTHLDTIIPEDREQMTQIMENARNTGVILGELEFWIEQKEGARRYVRSRTSTSKEKDSVSEFIITTDITSRKLAEDEVKRKKMKFLLEDGRTYLVKEFRPEISIEAFKDLIDIDYIGLIISRTPKKDLQKTIIGPLEHVWLGHNPDEEEHLFDKLISRIHQLQGKNAILIDRLDYLIFKYGFRETLAFLYNLRDTIYMKEQVIILSIDPSTISEDELNLIQKEMSEIEQRQVARPGEEQFEIIEKIYEKNSSGIKPSFSEIGAELGISKPTFRKRVRSLISNGYIVELTKGNKKVLELTQKGRSLFFK